jgi:hypothetical protein
MSYYEEAIELTSPLAAQLLGTSDGRVVGKANAASLRRAWARSLPGLPLSAGGRALGHEQRGALLNQSKRHPYGRVHETSSDGKSRSLRRSLQCVSRRAQARNNPVSVSGQSGSGSGHDSGCVIPNPKLREWEADRGWFTALNPAYVLNLRPHAHNTKIHWRDISGVMMLCQSEK